MSCSISSRSNPSRDVASTIRRGCWRTSSTNQVQTTTQPYIHSVLCEDEDDAGRLLALPDADLGGGPPVFLDADIEHARRRFFRVVEKHPHAKKTVRTDEDTARGVSSWLVATFAHWSPLGRIGERCDVYEEAAPCVQDIAQWVPWKCWRRGLLKWHYIGPSDVQGCQEVRAPASADWDAIDELRALPLTISLERLGEQGWVAGRPSDQPHASKDTLKILNMTEGFSLRPSYYTCVLELPALWASGLEKCMCASTRNTTCA